MIATYYLLFSVMFLTFQNSNSGENYSPDENSYFPLLPGSYWKYQDSCYTDECEQIQTEDLGFNPRTIYVDSIISLLKKDSCWEATGLSFIGIKDKKPVKIIYRCNKSGYVFKGIMSKKFGLEVEKLQESITNPKEGDTIYRNDFEKEPLIFTFNTTEHLFYAIPIKNPDLRYSADTCLYGSGIGLFEARSTTSAKVLLEYRIGNGPVIKLRKPR